jgi:hypothetical protein
LDIVLTVGTALIRLPIRLPIREARGDLSALAWSGAPFTAPA